MGLLDRDTIKVTDSGLQGFKEQLAGLQESKSFLFQEKDSSNPTTPQILAGGNPTGPTPGDKSIVQKIQERLGE